MCLFFLTKIMLLKMFVKDTFFAWNTPFFDNIIYYRHTVTLDVVNELTIAEFPNHQFGRFFSQEKKKTCGGFASLKYNSRVCIE